MTTEKFIEKATIKHGDRYDYDGIDNPKTVDKVSIICKEHGVFTQEVNAHINKGQGCPECGKHLYKNNVKKKYNTEWFIGKSREVHADRYDYSLVEYDKNTTPVSIICKTHGEFKQEPRSHIAGNGCIKCARDNNNYWSYSGWTKAGEQSQYFDGFKVYVVRCYSETEEFYKIGKTYNKIWLRFSRGQLPYEYEVLKVFEGSGLHICQLEEKLLKMNYEYKYKPELEFAGSQECFRSLDGIKGELDD